MARWEALDKYKEFVYGKKAVASLCRKKSCSFVWIKIKHPVLVLFLNLYHTVYVAGGIR